MIINQSAVAGHVSIVQLGRHNCVHYYSGGAHIQLPLFCSIAPFSDVNFRQVSN